MTESEFEIVFPGIIIMELKVSKPNHSDFQDLNSRRKILGSCIRSLNGVLRKELDLIEDDQEVFSPYPIKDPIIKRYTKPIRKVKYESKPCPTCSKVFQPYRKHQKFCSIKCRESFHLENPKKENTMEIELSSKDDTFRVCMLDGCEKEFKPKRPWQRFCCAAHTQRYHTLITRKGRELMSQKEDTKDTWRKRNDHHNERDT